MIKTNIESALLSIAKAIKDKKTWEEIGRTTLTSSADTISVADLVEKKYLKIEFRGFAVGGVLDTSFRFNNDSSNNYRTTYQAETAPGTAVDTGASNSIPVEKSSTESGQSTFTEIEMINDITPPYMIGHYHNVHISNSSALTSWLDGNCRWVNNGVSITRIDWINGGAGSFDIGSEIIVYGHD